MNLLLPWPEGEPAFAVDEPDVRSIPFVFASPHSGAVYPDVFKAASGLTPHELRRSEDCYVDELVAFAPRLGAPLIKAFFPRAYIDPNREPYEMDATMFDAPLPDFVNTSSPRVAYGLGTIAKMIADGRPIYNRKLTFAEAEARVAALYEPYHAALRRLIDETKAKFGYCVLIDCHSMPSIGGPVDEDNGLHRVDFVLGDRYGTSCAPALTAAATRLLSGFGYTVVRNAPYAGGFTTQHYGRPYEGVHALQIEVNRRLYMDEHSYDKRDGFSAIARHFEQAAQALIAVPADDIRHMRPSRIEETTPAPDLVLRDSVDADVPAIQAIYAHYVRNTTVNFEEVPPTVEEMAERRRAILARNLPFLVAERHGAVIGFSYAGPFRPRSAYRFTIESSIYLKPDLTRRGYGKALYSELINRCHRLGYRQMIAVIGDSANANSLALHRSLGFRQEGVLRGVGLKFGRWLDIVIMHRELDHDG